MLLAIADTERASFDRHDLIERIVEHVACTSMVVRIGWGDDYVAAEVSGPSADSLIAVTLGLARAREQELLQNELLTRKAGGPAVA